MTAVQVLPRNPVAVDSVNVVCDVVKYGPDEYGDAEIIDKAAIDVWLPADFMLTANSAFDVSKFCREYISELSGCWQYFGVRLSCSQPMFLKFFRE